MAAQYGRHPFENKMKLRRLRRRAANKHGHYDVHSYRQYGHENPIGPMVYHDAISNRRVRVGISRVRAWRTMK